MKIVSVNVWTGKDGKIERIMVAFDDRWMKELDASKPMPRGVYGFCASAKNHDGIELSDGRTLNAFY